MASPFTLWARQVAVSLRTALIWLESVIGKRDKGKPKTEKVRRISFSMQHRALRAVLARLSALIGPCPSHNRTNASRAYRKSSVFFWELNLE